MNLIIISGLVGAGAMGLGGLISAVIGKHTASSSAMGRYLLSFAGGVMISVVCFGLIPESIQLLEAANFSVAYNIALTIIGLLCGVVVVVILNRIVESIMKVDHEEPITHAPPAEVFHSGELDHAGLFRSGVLILIVLALHNIPEGMAIGAGGIHNFEFGLSIAVMLAIHNIPEGMAVATPLITSGVNKAKVVLLTALAGSTTLIGAILGVLVGGVSDIAVALSLSGAGGAMLYVVFAEIIPQTSVSREDKKHDRTVTLLMLAGIVIGLIAVHVY